MTNRTPRRAPLGIITATLLLIAAGAALAAAATLGGWWWLLMAPALALALLGGAGLSMDLPKVPRDENGNQLDE